MAVFSSTCRKLVWPRRKSTLSRTSYERMRRRRAPPMLSSRLGRNHNLLLSMPAFGVALGRARPDQTVDGRRGSEVEGVVGESVEA